MLLNVEDVLALPEYTGANPEVVRLKILALESAIRAYTHNGFTVRGARIQAASDGGVIRGTSPYIKGGDRIQIVRSGVLDANGVFTPIGVNDGLYDVASVSEYYTALDDVLYNADFNDVFLVRYPPEIKAGALELLKWDATGREKLGVASETISRHSVSYQTYTGGDMLMGYPSAMVGFLKPYMKARF